MEKQNVNNILLNLKLKALKASLSEEQIQIYQEELQKGFHEITPLLEQVLTPEELDGIRDKFFD